MELVDAPTMAPASCCLTSMGGPLIDTGREVAQFGRAYLSPDIVREAAKVLGLVDGEELQRAQTEVNDVTEMLAESEAQRADLEAKYDALRASMAETMQHGFVVDRKGTIRYRTAAATSRVAKET